MKIPENIYKPTEDKKVGDFVYSTSIEGLYYFAHSTYKDARGFFSEVARYPELETVTGKPFNVKQINHARSDKNVIRGIHAENWNKYIHISNGVCFSAIVDVRPDSLTFMNKESFILGHADYALDGSIYIPARAGNSMCVMEGPVDYLYFVDALYKDRDTSGDMAISLFDPDINVEWPIAREDMIISDRDLNAVTLREKFPTKF